MKIKEIFNTLIITKKIYIYTSVILISGIIFMLYEKKEPVYTNTNIKLNYTDKMLSFDNTEEKLKQILNKVEGVGDVEIIINYSLSEKGHNQSSTNKSEYYSLGDITQNQTSYEHKIIEGVLIVAQGGDNSKVNFNIRQAVSSYLGIPVHKVNILSMKQGE